MFGFLPHNLFTNHVAQNTTALSPRIWSQVSGAIMASDGDKRLVLAGDDFLGVGGLATSVLGDFSSEGGHYMCYQDATSTVLQSGTAKGGAVILTTDGDDEDEIWMSHGDTTGQLGKISDTAGDDHLTAFECRYSVSSIADSAQSSFIGLASPGLAVTNTMANATGVLASAGAFIGFQNGVDDTLDGDSGVDVDIDTTATINVYISTGIDI